ncbi:hypothetical protein [Desulfotruncus alcoholivorax]|uniref:hypothetical protein n=1 Tax=Desulfotruncus alcoholivorax TaxID=265477 RepID=UPI0003F6F70D|nr:hypothetical protein [Desulfotruncus alcoholivorax]
MFAVVTVPERAEQVQAAVQEFGDLVFCQAEKMDSGGIKSMFQSLSRVAADTLILDVDAGPGEDLVIAVKGYRIARPGVRIVLLVSDREPGDVTVAQLVGLGIYDISAGSDESDWALLTGRTLQAPPATFAQAARWHVSRDREYNGTSERVVIERHPIGAVTISVAGAASGIGCTHTALAIASHIAQKKYAVALLELNNKRSLGYLVRVIKLREGDMPDSYRVGNLHIFPIGVDVHDSELDQVFYKKLQQIRGRFKYIVVDLGELDHSKIADFSRSNLAVVVASAAPWRWHDLLLVLSQCGEQSNVSLAFIAPSEDFYKILASETGLKAYSLPYIPDPLRPDDAGEALQAMLSEVLPDKVVEQKRSFLRFFKK